MPVRPALCTGTRYGAADDIYLREVDPVPRADVVVDNRYLAAPRVVRG